MTLCRHNVPTLSATRPYATTTTTTSAVEHTANIEDATAVDNNR